MSERSWVLHEPLSSGQQGKMLCFVQMTGIGPMASDDPLEWARFSSEAAARQCPAVLHSLTFYEPRLASELPGVAVLQKLSSLGLLTAVPPTHPEKGGWA
jgi:hypothetical protein